MKAERNFVNPLARRGNACWGKICSSPNSILVLQENPKPYFRLPILVPIRVGQGGLVEFGVKFPSLVTCGYFVGHFEANHFELKQIRSMFFSM